MGRSGKLSVFLVQQGIWDMPLESMPLASGYLKAAALADATVRESAEITIFNYRGGTTLTQMANDIFTDGPPDVLACSVLGWNYRTFGALAETFRQLNPEGWVVFGGTHVANQGERSFAMFPAVDVIVNGEGELAFRELLTQRLAGGSPRDLGNVKGISFRDRLGAVVTTDPRDRIDDLDIIPSPALSGAVELTRPDGSFRYDVALMETNRGCPYKCSFCYWGGAVGQRIRAFSRERLRRELELYASLKVHTICLCDANFGLMPIDEEFVDDVIEIRERTGYPRALESSWAKNKSKVFYSIVRKMKDAGLRSSFTLALQTLNDETLRLMNRKNMKVNEWEDLVAWLGAEELECYAELIWGAPGETVETFLAGYDRLSQYVSRIAVYPILLLPNTEYTEKREQFGIVSVRGDNDDFEYVLAHNTMTMADNQRMQRFLFWSRVLADAAVLRHTWIGLRGLAELTQSQVLRNLDEWISSTDDEAAVPLQGMVGIGTETPGAAIDYLYREPDAKRMLERWWTESIEPLLPADRLPVVREIFRYDLLTQPIYRMEDGRTPAEVTPIRVGADEYAVRADIALEYDVPAILSRLRAKEEPDLRPARTSVDLYYRLGVEQFTTTTNSEEIVHFMGRPKTDLFTDEEFRPERGDGPYTTLLRDSSCG
ncbi:KedN5 family methylcobalamin-dependent radical SAM C-methyltransferase [Actinomadura fibrosa]|uniref:KedN5 family methylcobalamin-dependent radical SAM C-methyltransferase n=1 Tax=Actinomadura fibrosa TaxID=111802 RepID=A0ABW2Y2U4_9ACTN|nr:KedN5 family methylcobalamin-dependent radical SAM C-methyltransferase [Actinomadura fibrosa]